MSIDNHDNSQPIKIALGDLRHKTIGRHSVFMPLGIGYIASYAYSQIGPEGIEVRLYDDPNKIIKDIKEWRPNIVGLSNYCWNSELSCRVLRYAKGISSSIVCVAGGPEFPSDFLERKAYLLERPEIDFYVYFEGEIPFARLAGLIKKRTDVHCLRSIPQEGIASISPKTKELIIGKPLPRLLNLDDIPSPYLNGFMDQWFNGCFAPSIETTRGCPFSCGFCFAGQPCFSQIATFSIQRLKDELRYIAERISKYPGILLSFCDSNFGMYERDEEIALYIRGLQDEFGWPNAFDVTTGKANYDRILRIASLLKNRMHVTCSVQSMNPKTLEVIKRKNISIGEYRNINMEIKKRGMVSVAELIVPLPEETKDSFFKGMKMVINAGVEYVVPYTTMFLKGTYLASKECREKYQMETKFRILPRQFGEYSGEKCFEIEEVCVSNSTLSFDDYLEIRGFSLISSIFSSRQFDIIHRHIKELGINSYDYLYFLWEMIKTNKTSLSEVYNSYIKETKEELYDSKKNIYSYHSKKENYKKLLDENIGDNLIRKYKTEVFLEHCVPSIELAYLCMEEITHNSIPKNTREALEAAKNWAIALRNLSAVFKNPSYVNSREIVELPYDVTAWYIRSSGSELLSKYKRKTHYEIFCDIDKLGAIFDEMKKLYGVNLSFQVSRILVNWDISNFWRQCKTIEKEMLKIKS